MATLASSNVQPNRLNIEKTLVIEKPQRVDNLRVRGVDGKEKALVMGVNFAADQGAEYTGVQPSENAGENSRVLETKRKQLVLEVSHDVNTEQGEEETEGGTTEDVTTEEGRISESSTRSLKDAPIADVDVTQFEWEDVIVESKTKTLTLVLNRGITQRGAESASANEQTSEDTISVKDTIDVFESRTKELTLEANGYGNKASEDSASVVSEGTIQMEVEKFNEADPTSISVKSQEEDKQSAGDSASVDSKSITVKKEDAQEWEWEVLESKTKELLLEVEGAAETSDKEQEILKEPVVEATEEEVQATENLHADFCPVKDYANWPWMQQFAYDHWIFMWLLPIITLLLGMVCSYGSLVFLDVYLYGSDYGVDGVQDLISQAGQKVQESVGDTINNIEATIEHLFAD